ncbi:MAG: hypothetical protein JO101_11370 [Candidatus Eremiobacteraeota bacterium]|nr:hypothetical protein [Candidatus Eremiobacteraeota bacterium]
MRRSAFAALAAALCLLAVTYLPSQTFKVGTRIACVLDERLDSSKISYGTTFKLKIVDTSLPALNGSEILGYITDVRAPSGGQQGKVGFFLTDVKLQNGKKKPISAYVVNKRVVQYNPAAQYASRQRLSPTAGVPYGTVTPGPITWQMKIGNGPSSVSESQGGPRGGYVYAAASQWPIVVVSGTPVTVELAESLTIP